MQSISILWLNPESNLNLKQIKKMEIENIKGKKNVSLGLGPFYLPRPNNSRGPTPFCHRTTPPRGLLLFWACRPGNSVSWRVPWSACHYWWAILVRSFFFPRFRIHRVACAQKIGSRRQCFRVVPLDPKTTPRSRAASSALCAGV
jgi:hypothetical protein